VADEADKADRFQQGLQWDIQEKVITHQFKTYDEVLTAALFAESFFERRNKNRGYNKSGKRPFQ